MARVVFGEGEVAGDKPLEKAAATIKVEPPPEGMAEGPGTRIGRYKLLEQIGQGGFGVVYMAEQVEPVQRKVALKVVKAGMDTKEVIARFEAERQALALMDHPNIARVLDAGTTQAGRPYFVMELVKGIPITEFCDLKKLSPAERLELFIKVCQAVQHAHQKAIIHRDLKPSNVLVTLHDGEPVPKVIDFGIAKALGPKLTEKTLFTGFAHLLGTPAYMSPEQAELSGLDIDTRSDIYSLGVLLYELLTGVTPFDKESLAKAALDEVRRMIRETEPPKPSRRLTELVAADVRRLESSSESDRASLRRLLQQRRELIHQVRGDLDWIVMKCLEKDRRRRYETANGLAMDVGRHLQYEPVVARPPSKLYEFQKTVRRHKVGFAAAGAIVLVLAAGVVVSTWQAVRATRAEREQARLRQLAETKEKTSEQVSQFLKDMLKGVGPSVALGRKTEMLREILDRTAERIGTDLKEQPEVEAELRFIIGNTYFELAEFAKAEAMHRESLRLRRLTFGPTNAATADSLSALGEAVRGYPESEALHREALAVRRQIFGNGHPDVATSLNLLAYTLYLERRLDEAESVERESLAMRRRLFGSEHLDVAISLEVLGLVLQRQSKFAEAKDAFYESLEIQKNLEDGESPGIAATLSNIARLFRDWGKPAEGEPFARESLAMRRKLLGDGHPKVAIPFRNLITILQMQGKLAEAETLGREFVKIQKTQFGGESTAVADALASLSDVVASQGKFREAENLAREVVEIRRKASGDQDQGVVNALYKLSGVLQAQGRWSDAGAVIHEEAARIRALFAEGELPVNASLRIADLMSRLGLLMRGSRKYADAEAAFREALVLRRKVYGNQHLAVADSIEVLAMTLNDQGKAAKAEPLLREAIAILKLNTHNRDLGWPLELLGWALSRQGKLTEAEACYREAVAIGTQHPWAYSRLGGLLAGRGDWEEAEPLLLKALHLFQKRSGDQFAAYTTMELGRIFSDKGKLVEAEAAFRHALLIFRSLPDRMARARALVQLADMLQAQGKHAEAEVLYREELAVRPRIPGDQAPEVALLRLNLGKTLRGQGRADEAAALYREGAKHADPNTLNGLAWPMATSPKAADRDGPTAVLLAEKAVAATARTNYQIMDTLAAAHAEAGQFTNAVCVQQKAIALIPAGQTNVREDFESRLRLFEANSPFREYWGEINRLQSAGKLADAESLLREQLAMYRLMFDADHPRVAGTLASLTHVMVEADKFTEAEPLARDCVAIRERKLPDHWSTFNAQSLLGGCLLGQEKYEEAEPLLLSSYEGMRQRKDTIPAAGKTRLNEALERLVQLYEAWGKPEQAAEWKQKLAEFEKATALAQP